MAVTNHRQAAIAFGVSKSTVWRTVMRQRLHNTQQSLPNKAELLYSMLGISSKLAEESAKDHGQPWPRFARLYNYSVKSGRQQMNLAFTEAPAKETLSLTQGYCSE
jgi:hypothetical protein